jgi:hypothetical protein
VYVNPIPSAVVAGSETDGVDGAAVVATVTAGLAVAEAPALVEERGPGSELSSSSPQPNTATAVVRRAAR